MIRIIVGPVQSLLFIIESNRNARHRQLFGFQFVHDFYRYCNTGGIVAGGCHPRSLAVIMSSEQKIAWRSPDSTDHVATHAAEILHLDITADLFELLRNVIGRSRRPRCRGLAAFACRIGKPGHVVLETVRGDCGKSEQRENDRCDE